MAGDFILGPFGRLLPRPGASRTSSALSSDTNPRAQSSMPDSMMLRGPLSKDVPINNELPGLGQQLPSVSHILAGRSYHDLVPLEVPPSHDGLGIFNRPQYSRGNSGDMAPGLPHSYGYLSHPQSIRTHRERNDALPSMSPNLLAQPPSHRHQYLPKRPVPSLLSRYDIRPSAGSDATVDQPHMPRVLREEDIPGKGVCYIYDDGSFCPKAIDGDTVNPQWGVTKAGKPRKRLAQACTTCREKKIRCDPGSGLSICSQCSKFNRECRFEQQQM